MDQLILLTVITMPLDFRVLFEIFKNVAKYFDNFYDFCQVYNEYFYVSMYMTF